MKKNNSYIYPKTIRETIEGQRHYNINDKEKLPSVTTILKATEPREKQDGLAAWRARVGEPWNGDAQDLGKIYFRRRLFRSH